MSALLAALLLLLASSDAAAGEAPAGAAAGDWVHAVVIDAGSTGSRAHVFRYRWVEGGSSSSSSGGSSSSGALGDLEVDLPEAVLKVSPGLSSRAADPRAAAASLRPLVEFAKREVPREQWARTPVRLMATAGLRLLGNGTAEGVMAEVRGLLAASGLSLGPPAEGARVLSGVEEGVWGWVAANFVTGALQAAAAEPGPPPRSQLLLGRKGAAPRAVAAAAPPPPPLLGVLELGGGSLQVTLLPREGPPPGQGAPLALPGVDPGRLYARSFDGLGLQASHARWQRALAARRSRSDPCLPRGYLPPGSRRGAAAAAAGSGDWDACLAGVAALLPPPVVGCGFERCGLGGSWLPELEGAVFLGLDNFFYTARALGLPSDRPVSLAELQPAARALCGRSWSSLRRDVLGGGGGGGNPFLLKACFASALVVSLLRDGLRVAPAAPALLASNSVPGAGGRPVGVNWALGALLADVLQLGRGGAGGGKRTGGGGGGRHGHVVLAAPGSGGGAGDAAAAGIAVGVSLALLALGGLAHLCRVGVVRGPAAAHGASPPAGSPPGRGSYRRISRPASPTQLPLAAPPAAAAPGSDGGRPPDVAAPTQRVSAGQGALEAAAAFYERGHAGSSGGSGGGSGGGAGALAWQR